MHSQYLTGRQATALYTLFLLGGALTVGTHPANGASIICLIIAAVLFLPLLVCFCSLQKQYDAKSLFDMFRIKVGKGAEKISAAIYTVYAVMSAMLTLRHYTEAVALTTLPQTPQWFTGLCIMLCTAFLVSMGLRAVGKTAQLFIVLGLLLLFVTTSFSLSDIKNSTFDIEMPTVSDSLSTSLLFFAPFGDSVLLLCAGSGMWHVKSQKGPMKTAFIIAFVILSLIVLRDILLLGGEIYGISYVPSYTAISMLSAFGIIQHLEIIESSVALFCIAIRLSVCLYAANAGLRRIFSYQKGFHYPLAILIAFFAAGMVHSTEGLIAISGVFAICTIPLQILPIFLLKFGKKQLKSKTDYVTINPS